MPYNPLERRYRILKEHDSPALRSRLFSLHRYLLPYLHKGNHPWEPDSVMAGFSIPPLSAKEGQYLIRLKLSEKFKDDLIEHKFWENEREYDPSNPEHREFVDSFFTLLPNITRVFLIDDFPHAGALSSASCVPLNQYNRHQMFVLKPEDYDLFFYTDKNPEAIRPSPEIFL